MYYQIYMEWMIWKIIWEDGRYGYNMDIRKNMDDEHITATGIMLEIIMGQDYIYIYTYTYIQVHSVYPLVN